VPTTFTVSNLLDAGPDSLRQAIINANMAAGPDTIAFQPGLTGTIALAGSHLSVTDSVSILGPGAGLLTVSGNNASRIFLIDSAAAGFINVSIRGLTLRDGQAPGSQIGGGILMGQDENLVLSGMDINHCTASNGGGIAIGFNGRLTLENSTVHANTANANIAAGGGLYLSSRSSTVIRNSTITANAAATDGPTKSGARVAASTLLRSIR
jgi:Right handed beta helix region